MHCGPLAKINEEDIARITLEGSEKLRKRYEEAPAEIGMMARLCFAASGGHVAIEDGFFFATLTQVLLLKPKHRAKWHTRVDDGKGTHRRVFWDGMLRVKDDSGQGVPMIPMSVSLRISEASRKVARDSVLPQLQLQQILEECFTTHLPPPVTEDAPIRRARESRLKV